MRQIYIHVYPKEKLNLDNKFYEQTKKLYWITPEHLDIKKIYINQLSNSFILSNYILSHLLILLELKIIKYYKMEFK